MALRSYPTFSQQSDKFLEIKNPAYKGLDLQQLEFEQDVNSTPYMLNMMYRNGTFSKRYGQEVMSSYSDEIFEIIKYKDSIIVHSGTKLYKDGVEITGFTVPASKGTFANYNRHLYYLQGPVIGNVTATKSSSTITSVTVDKDKYIDKYHTASKTFTYDGTDWTSLYINENKTEKLANLGITITGTPSANDTITITVARTEGKFSQYDGSTWEDIDPYVPIVSINRKPDGSEGDANEEYNIVGSGFINKFHGDNSSTEFVLTDKYLDSSKTPIVEIDNEKWTYDASLSAAKTFKIDYTTGKVTLKSAAPTGVNNVIITIYKTDDESINYKDQIYSSKYFANFGGNNNSRLFLAGNGKGTYYYSGVFDASYFPYNSYARLGNSTEDITGFGQQYNTLFIFKPTEIFSLTYYQNTSDTTTDETEIGKGAFSSQVVNSTIGCDCPYTIQVINNQLTWFSSKNGVCTLVSTNILDERNVRPISENINHTNNFDVKGILDIELNKNSTPIYDTVQSIDFENKYFLIFPKEYTKTNNTWSITDLGYAYVWDYEISPFVVTSSKITNAKDLSWFLFDNIYAKDIDIINKELVYVSTKTGKVSGTDKYLIVKLNKSYSDFDYTDTSDTTSINAYYMTPFMQFDAVEYLKTIKNIYIQCRGDTASSIDVYYYTEESSLPEQDPDSIRIGGRIWTHMDWSTFEWLAVNWANVFRRKCSLKKVQMASFLFRNNEEDRDMSITHITLQYQVVKLVK